MTNDEKESLKARYKEIKESYKCLLKDIKNIPRDSREYYETLGQLMVLKMQIVDIRNTLLDDKFGKFYPATLLANFILGNEENQRGGR